MSITDGLSSRLASLHSCAVLARLQQIITLGLLLALLAWVGVHAARREWFWLVVGVVLILAGHALVLALETCLMAWVNRRDRLPPARAAEIVRAWWGEVCSAPRIFCWEQPFRANAWPDQPEGRPGQRGLVLVHGFVCNRGIWNRWFPRLRAHGVPHVAVDLEPVFGDIDDYVTPIDTAVAALQASTGLPPLIVAHSMGGLAVRAWLRRHGGIAALPRVHHIVTLGTPHTGTVLARFGVSSNTRQMGFGSPWLTTLAGLEPREVQARFTCVYSNCDNIVFPTSTATLPHAEAVGLTACAHVHMVDHAPVFDLVMARLLPPATPAAAAAQP